MRCVSHPSWSLPSISSTDQHELLHDCDITGVKSQYPVGVPADLADVQQVSSLVYFTCIVALAWDWVMSVPDEYQILYVFAAVSNCQTMMYVITFLAILALNTHNLLFFRVRAVYGNSHRITAFGMCYIAEFGVSLCEPLHYTLKSCTADDDGGDIMLSATNQSPFTQSLLLFYPPEVLMVCARSALGQLGVKCKMGEAMGGGAQRQWVGGYDRCNVMSKG
ncbi:hypothetical protein FIBSPDRAFT_1037938 [Athelia psychrophila]|uniref:Uncharacterized protein n=1 Tax=Athelia psychrophila TaxID=1759441 RepID=A0A166TIP8_9AGAM|nr:hypothetical protein FIBSPDRAFT_1037938 [Fibularhizoctonia sp. CBS 109695]